MSRATLLFALGVAAAGPAVPAGAAIAAARLPPRAADVVASETRLPFLSDDYARALGEARARELPLFIEAWAPW